MSVCRDRAESETCFGSPSLQAQVANLNPNPTPARAERRGNGTQKGGAEQHGVLIGVQLSLQRVYVRMAGRTEQQEVPGLTAWLEGWSSKGASASGSTRAERRGNENQKGGAEQHGVLIRVQLPL